MGTYIFIFFIYKGSGVPTPVPGWGQIFSCVDAKIRENPIKPTLTEESACVPTPGAPKKQDKPPQTPAAEGFPPDCPARIKMPCPQFFQQAGTQIIYAIP